jgi:hypothetical protein
MNEEQKLAFRIYNDLFQLYSKTKDIYFEEVALRVADRMDLWKHMEAEGD